MEEEEELVPHSVVWEGGIPQTAFLTHHGPREARLASPRLMMVARYLMRLGEIRTVVMVETKITRMEETIRTMT